MKAQNTPLAEEQFNYSYNKALEIMGELIRDGNNGLTIQTIFMTGSAMAASANKMTEETYLAGSKYFFDVYEDFSEDLNQATTVPMPGMKK